MPFRSFRRRAALVAVVALPCYVAALWAEVPSGVAATVDGRSIPRRLVEAFLRNGREALALDPASAAGRETLGKLRAAIIDELVERSLIAAEAERRGLAPTAAQIDASERRVVDFHGGEERYGRFLSYNGFTRDEYRESVLAAALRGEALTAALTRDLMVSEDEAKVYYEAHQKDAEFQWPERVTGSHIQINAKPGVIVSQLEIDRPGLRRNTPEMKAAMDAEIARKRQVAEDLRAQALRPGADFAALAARHSEDLGTKSAGGSLGTFPMGTHPQALDGAFFGTAAGQVGPLVETDFGFHVIRTEARLPAGPRTLAEATPIIRGVLLRAKKAEALRAWLKDALAKAKVEVRPWDDAPKPEG